MEREMQIKVASVLAMLVGVWAAISPLFIDISGAARINLIVTGAVLAVAGAVQYFVKSSIPSWLSMLAAAWLFASAYIFTVSTAMVWNETLSAIGAFLLSSWDGVEVSEARQHITHSV